MSRRAMLLLTAVAVAMLLAGDVALAKNIKCPNRDRNLCVGTNGADTMTGSNRSDIIKARGGADTVNARGGKDRVSGGDGGDHLFGELGNDKLNGGANTDNEDDFLAGGPGDDTLVESPGMDRYGFESGWGQDQITGDGDALPMRDNDTLCFNCGMGVTTALSINLAAGTATDGPNNVIWDAATEPFIENTTGGSAGDNIFGSSRSNFVNGFDGADTINVSGDIDTDLVNCGDGDGDTDTVIRDPGDNLLGNTCNGDTVTP